MSAELCICPVRGVHMRGCNEGGLLTDVDAFVLGENQVEAAQLASRQYGPGTRWVPPERDETRVFGDLPPAAGRLASLRAKLGRRG